MSMLYEALVFRKEDKLFYKLDPRVKLLVLMVYVVSIIILNDIIYSIITFVMLLTLAFYLANPRRTLRSLRASYRFFIILFLIIYIFSSFPSLVSLSGLYKSMLAVMKLAALMLAFSLFFTSTHPDDLAQALVKFGLKFEHAYTLVLSMRFIPTIVRDIQLVYDAQRSRGLELEKGSFVERLKKMLPILIPAFIITLLRVDRIAEAMESRAFGSSVKRSFMYELKITLRDVAYSLITILPPIVLLITYIVFNVRFDSILLGV